MKNVLKKKPFLPFLELPCHCKQYLLNILCLGTRIRKALLAELKGYKARRLQAGFFDFIS
jgi:hypothetical protein